MPTFSFFKGTLYCFLIVIFSACTTGSKSSFSPEGKPTVAGTIRIFKNSQEVTETCKVCFESQFSCYQLDKSGKVILSVDNENTYVKRVRCDTEDFYGIDERWSPHGLKVKKVGGDVVYFGDVTFIFGKMKVGFNWSQLGLEFLETFATGGTSKNGSLVTGRAYRVFVKDYQKKNVSWINESMNRRNVQIRKSLLTGLQPIIIQ